MAASDGIKHVVVVMLENRSFDSMFGKLYPKSVGFEGLQGNETNPRTLPDGSTQEIPVWNDDGMGPATACIPDPDPGELFSDINMQIFGLGGSPSDPPKMNGFVDSYVRQPGPPQPDPMSAMHYFTEKQIPVISQLARAFGVSDQWHASAPCQTWPNRFFAHTGTAGGYVTNEPYHLPYEMETIFERLSANGKSWKVYFHDLPQSAALANIWHEIPFHFRFVEEEFAQDCRNGDLPNYSFIEPRYFISRGELPNDQHPPHNIAYGEQLIADVYNAVRSAPSWKQTLLIVTYDEHGGCFDHVRPPRAVPPGNEPTPSGFAFDRYGVRVPAVIISPYMPPGSIVRANPTGVPHQGPPYPYDHTSIIATLRKLFGLGAPLTARDGAAPDLIGALSLDEPTNDGPASVKPASRVPTAQELSKAASAPPNPMQRSLTAMSVQLPVKAVRASAHIAALKAGTVPLPHPPVHSVEDALRVIGDRFRSLIGVP
jgi:phospholipase C